MRSPLDKQNRTGEKFSLPDFFTFLVKSTQKLELWDTWSAILISGRMEHQSVFTKK